MRLLAISGSARRASTNTALLIELARTASAPVVVDVYSEVGELPVFSPDREGDATPQSVLDLAASIGRADGIIVACPEYVHGIPGGFKNAVDWMVSRPEFIAKPIALVHATHGAADVLRSLTRILGTVSERFTTDVTERFLLRSKSPEQVAEFLREPEQQARMQRFIANFVATIQRPQADESAP